jgi:CheY-like chemotaxis protein
LNLLSNAVKFTPAGGRVHVTLRTLDAEIEIRVSDTGRGIAAEFLPHVFVPFRQADGSITRFHGGLGLGLSIAKQLVELHQGRVESHSEGEGRGATFVVRIPLLDSELQVKSARRAAEFRLGRPTANMRHVLLVDDDPDTRQLLQTILETAGFRTTAAENVENALQLLKQELPDLLISDIGLPGTDGYELIRQVRMLPEAKARGVPALALTAYSRSEDRARALRAGFAMHIPKPVEPAALVAAVETLCPPTARHSPATSNA